MKIFRNLFLNENVKQVINVKKIGGKMFEGIFEHYFQKENITEAAMYLGMLEGANTIVLNDDSEMNILQGFAICDYRWKDGKTIIDKCIRDKIWANDIEKQIIFGFAQSQTSLFEVIDVSKKKNIIIIRDLLNDKEDTAVIDLNLSKTINTAKMIFTRIIAAGDINTMGGASCVFDINSKDILIREYKKRVKKVHEGLKKMERYRLFYEFNQDYGLELMYKEI